jgi:uncharacterized protein (DUF433 family)
MSIFIITIPLSLNEASVMHVGNTRVSLDSVIVAFDDGATPEEIVQSYPTLNLSDVYAVISYYLQHREEVEEYMRQRRSDRLKLREEIESRFDPHGIRARLLARRDHE